MKSTLTPFKQQFLDLALRVGALRFGEFKLKSGRISPYFFNSGTFSSGAALWQLAGCYLDAIAASGVNFDLLFGPAYKGIPLVSAVAVALAARDGKDVPYCYNRKEAKDHGESGVLVGHLEPGRTLLIDDVITAGSAIRDCVPLIRQNGSSLVGITIAFDRQEKGYEGKAATQEVSDHYQVPVISIATAQDLLTYLTDKPNFSEMLPKIATYREEYGIII